MPNHKNEWTVMVYLAGDNNLSEEMIYAIKEMYRVGVTDDFEVIILFDPSAIGPPVRRCVISKRRIEAAIRMHEDIATEVNMQKSMAASATMGSIQSSHAIRAQDPSQVADVVNLDMDGLIEKFKEEVQDMRVPPNERRVSRRGEENSGSPLVLKEFICSSIRKHPAYHYMLVLSGHGSGAVGDFLRDDNPLEGDRPTSLSIPNLRSALEGALQRNGKIDILGMDSCLMSMAEVAYELKHTVKFLVGSEGFVLNTGWPYHRVLEAVKDNIGKLKRQALPKEDLAKDLAHTIVKKYISYYIDYEVAGASTDQSACNVEEFKTLVRPIRNLAAALIWGLDHPVVKDEIVLAHWEAQSYKAEQYTDLYDFCERLQLRCCRKLDAIDAFENHASASQRPEGLLETLSRAIKMDSVPPKAGTIQEADVGDQETVWAAKEGADEAAELLSKVDEVLKARKAKEDVSDSSNARDSSVASAKVSCDSSQPISASQVIGLIWSCYQVRMAIEKVVMRSCYSGPAFQHSHGLSVFFPWFKEKGVLETYEDLRFAMDTRIVMEDEDNRTIASVEQWLNSKGLAFRCSATGLGPTMFYVTDGEIDYDKEIPPSGCRVEQGTSWAKFLRKYLKTTRRERRNQEYHPEKPIVIDPPVNTTLASLVLPFRTCINPRGLGLGTGSMKNPPHGFYRDNCNCK